MAGRHLNSPQAFGEVALSSFQSSFLVLEEHRGQLLDERAFIADDGAGLLCQSFFLCVEES